MAKISKEEFAKLCDDVYRDRKQIYAFNPRMGKRDALEWMILCSLLPLLDIAEEPDASVTYTETICEILENRMMEKFDVRAILEELAESIQG